MMRFDPLNKAGRGDKPKAAGSRPRELGIQHIVTQNAENMLAGKRKRSVGQDANPQMEISTTSSHATITPSVDQKVKATILAGTPSPASYFSTTSLSHNGPTPPMSPDKQSVLDNVEPSPETLSTPKLEGLKRNLKTQIGLEILLKHDELRLIEQELGKCQIALEQLRRCTEIPYPATKLSLDVSNGVGLPVRNGITGILPRSPAPWGVTDGPYSRHYAKWLLPDPTFDGGEEVFAAGQHGEFARSTRGKPIESVVMTSKRGNKSKAPIIPLVPKDKSGPMIIKRKSDGKMVKLRCLDCARDDFGSAQGFINHCRIQHHRSFTSHDAAAAACGEDVELDPAGTIVGALSPAQPTGVLSTSGTVHPLIRSAHFIKPAPEDTGFANNMPCSEIRTPSAVTTTFPVPKQFQASPLTPNLSALIRNKGLGINVQDLVIDAKRREPSIEVDDMEYEDDAETSVQTMADSIYGGHPRIAGSKQPSNSHSTQGGKTSSFGQLRGGAMLSSMQTDLFSDESGDLELEPSPTNESNQAPSLVDDDEDDDYEGHSPASTSESDDDNSEVNFQIEDEDTSNLSPIYPDSGKQKLGSVERRRSAFRRQFSKGREEKHVSFVSPSPAREMSGHDSKRRKVGG